MLGDSRKLQLSGGVLRLFDNVQQEGDADAVHQRGAGKVQLQRADSAGEQLFALLGQQLSSTLVQVAVKKDDRASFNFFRFQV